MPEKKFTATMEKIEMINTKKTVTFNRLGMDAKKVLSRLRMLFNLTMERNGRRIRIVRSTFRLDSLLIGVKPTTLTTTMMKSIQFQASRR